jgi:hypothetical protein
MSFIKQALMPSKQFDPCPSERKLKVQRFMSGILKKENNEEFKKDVEKRI